jgi:hypothetical protein
MINPGALEKGGVGALELVAMDMKARLSYFYKHTHSQPYVLIYVSEIYIILYFSNFRGMYLCRTLSYKGAEFEIVEATLDDKMMV